MRLFWFNLIWEVRKRRNDNNNNNNKINKRRDLVVVPLMNGLAG